MKQLSKAILLILILGQCAWAGENKSLTKAFFLSLIVPGGGEYYLGYHKAGIFFFTTEIFLGLGVYSYSLYSNWRLEDARAFAAQYAGINSQKLEENEELGEIIANYSSLEEYNHYQLISEDNPKLLSAQDGFNWEWMNEDHWSEYRKIRTSSLKAAHRVRVLTSFVLLNHLCSGLNILRLKRKPDLATNKDFFWQVKYNYLEEKCLLVWTKKF